MLVNAGTTELVSVPVGTIETGAFDVLVLVICEAPVSVVVGTYVNEALVLLGIDV